MKTTIWEITDINSKKDQDKLQEAANYLIKGELVAFPTETVYGLGASALEDEAVRKVFKAKGRPSDNPLIVHVASQSDLSELVSEIPEIAQQLMNQFWPGPLTIVLKSTPGKFSKYVTAGLDSIAVRMPDHPIALSIIKAAGIPIAAPSANQSGRPSPTTAKHVLEDLTGLIAGIVDGGSTKVGLESTVVDCTEAVPIILRQGGVTQTQLEACVGIIEIDPGLKPASTPKSPGQKYQHYAPKVPFILVAGSPAFLQVEINKMKAQGKCVGVYAWKEHEAIYNADLIIAEGSLSDPATIAETMYGVLRKFDQTKVDIILGEIVPEFGIGTAIMDRLRRASGHNVITEHSN